MNILSEKLKPKFDDAIKWDNTNCGLIQCICIDDWVININVNNNRIETSVYRKCDGVEGASWKGFKIDKVEFKDIEDYIHARTKGEFKNQRPNHNYKLLIS